MYNCLKVHIKYKSFTSEKIYVLCEKNSVKVIATKRTSEIRPENCNILAKKKKMLENQLLLHQQKN